MSTTKGFFLSFEGADGSGKSTQLRILGQLLSQLGYPVTCNAEPGGTPIGQQIRRILLDPASSDLDPTAELLLMFASRAQAASELIRPALEQGSIVLSDRFTDSSLAYQGHARNLGFSLVRGLHRLTLGTLLPELTICIDIDLETGLARAQQRNLTAALQSEARLDRQSVEFHRAVHEAYRRIASEEPDRFLLVEGRGSVEEVAERVRDLVLPRLRLAVGY